MSFDKPRVQHLDWLRALAVALVVVGHGQHWLAPGGAIGVSVFFVLSGYLIASILLREGMMTAGNILKFVARRIVRIYPMYVFEIFLTTLFIGIYHRDQIDQLTSIIPDLLTFTGEVPSDLGYAIGVLWTLAVEFWFYVTFPVLLWAMLRSGHLFVCIFFGIAVSLSAKILGSENLPLQYYDHFLIGALGAAAIKFGRIPNIFDAPHLFVGAFCLIAVFGEIPSPGIRGLGWFVGSLAVASITGIAIVAAHRRPPTASLPWLAFVGRISYSIYLMHAIILDVFVAYKHMNTAGFQSIFPVAMALYPLIVLAVSTATYFAIEQPIIRAAHRRIA